MKICFISTMPAHKWGGSEELWAAAARYALGQKHEVFISAPASKEPLHAEFAALKSHGAHLYVRTTRDDRSVAQRGAFKLQRILKNIPPIPHHYYAFSEAVNNFNPDLICISQGGVFDVVEYPEVIWLANNSGKPFFLIGQSNLEHKVYPYPYLQRIRAIYRKARKIYFVSARNLEVAQRQLATTGFTNHAVIQNPCRIQDKTAVAYPDTAVIQFAMVGRLQCRNKGHDILFQVFSSEEWKSRNWNLNIFGTGDDKEYLQELAVYYGISEKVHFHGFENHVQEIWKKNHILLMPSIEEGTPLALIEAMACGRTAVVTDVGGNAALITEGETGFVAEAATPKLFSSALERAWEQKVEWKALGIKAHAFIETYIDPQPGKHLLDDMLASL